MYIGYMVVVKWEVVMGVMARVYWVHGAGEMRGGDGYNGECILGA